MSSTDPNPPSASELSAFAYRLLGQREYSVSELERRLRRKWPQLDDVALEELLAALIDENLLSDERFAESYVRSQVQRHSGPLKIRAALRERGVSEAHISAALEDQAGAWTDLAAAWLARQHPGPLDFDARGTYYRRLVNRGFTHDQAMDAVNCHPGG
ncbi:MAG: regulatory protein RecX, partial [Xanthomonadales bacterium]|nr:regulatory protein RecX [Xanthomonadales bacterium]